MSLRIPYTNIKNADEAFKVVKSKITPSYLEQFKVDAKIQYDDASKCVSASGKGFDLEIRFEETECVLDLTLAFLLKPFKDKILGKIGDQLKKNI